MTAIKTTGDRLARAAAKRAFHAGKYLYQRLSALGSPRGQRILFILGCQRSGTTLMQQLFDADPGAAVYGEFSRITRTAKTPNVRLRPLEEVRRIIERDPARLVVAKPICETQNALRLLGFFPEAKALFLYRHYAAVAASNLKEFGERNGIQNLQPIVAGDAANWRAEGVPPDVRALVQARYREDMQPHDAAALFWYVRNRFFFDLGLDRHPAVLPLRYEDLLRDPAAVMQGIYRFAGAPFTGRGLALVRPEPPGRKRVSLSPDIEELCAGLLERLDAAREKEGRGR
jgi:hypothetical protein